MLAAVRITPCARFQKDPQSRRPIGAASILRPQIIGDDRVDSDAKANGPPR